MDAVCPKTGSRLYGNRWEMEDLIFTWRQGRKLVVTDRFLVARPSEDSVSTVHPLERAIFMRTEPDVCLETMIRGIHLSMELIDGGLCKIQPQRC